MWQNFKLFSGEEATLNDIKKISDHEGSFTVSSYTAVFKIRRIYRKGLHRYKWSARSLFYPMNPGTNVTIFELKEQLTPIYQNLEKGQKK